MDKLEESDDENFDYGILHKEMLDEGENDDSDESEYESELETMDEEILDDRQPNEVFIFENKLPKTEKALEKAKWKEPI